MSIHVSIVTPDQKVFHGEADYVSLPGSEGSFGVLSGHAPLLSYLRPGFVEVQTGDSKHSFTVESGFAEVRDNNLTVIVEGVVDASKIDAEATRKELASMDMSPVNGDDKIDARIEKQDLLRFRLQIVSGAHSTTAHH